MNLAFFEGLSEADLSTPLRIRRTGVLTVSWLLHQTAGHQSII